MTGTADTEAEEFAKIYKLDVDRRPDQPAAARASRSRTSVYRTEQEKCDAIVTDIIEKQQTGPPGARRHGLDREVREALEHAQAARRQARRAQREVPRAGSRDRRAGRAARARSRSPPTWPAAAPTSCSAATPSSWRGSRRLAEQIAERLPKGAGAVRRRRRVRLLLPPRRLLPRAAAGDYERIFDALQEPDRRRARGGRRRSAACTSSAPSATRRAASTTSCAAAPAVRATRARRASTSRSKTT